MNEETIKHILVIRFRRVGDAVLSTVLCSSLRRTFPNARIDYVVNEGIDSLFEGHPDIDRLITFNQQENHSFFRYAYKVWRITKETPYDIILDTRGTVRTLFFSLFSLRSPFRIGVAKKYNIGILNHPVNVRLLKHLNIVQWLLQLLTPLKNQFNVNETDVFQLFPSKENSEKLRHSMLQAGITFDKPVVFVAATTRLHHKMWGTKPMAAILQHLIDDYDCQLVFNASGVERELLDEIRGHMRDSRNWFCDVPAKSLAELSALISCCHVFFGNEGGPRHIAHALSVPSFAIYPPNTSAAKWLPNPSEKQQFIAANPEYKNSNPEQQGDWLSSDDVWKKLAPFIEANSPATL